MVSPQECSAYRLSERMRKPFSTQKAQRRTQKAQKKREIGSILSSGLCFLHSSLCFLCSISAQSTLVPNTSGKKDVFLLFLPPFRNLLTLFIRSFADLKKFEQ